MRESLKKIIKIQDLDVKLIRLMRVKNARRKELKKIHELKEGIKDNVSAKEKQILELKKEIRLGETQVKEIQEKISKLETQQAAVKKMDEFNALTQEMTATGRERNAIEQRLSDLMDKLSAEEDLLVTLRESLRTTEESSLTMENEIVSSIQSINEEGQALLQEREALIPQTPADVFKIYERLLHNKKDRVVVPIENRVCSGCHIVLTAQHENMVRKGDRLVFCEHCSRIHYWQETPELSEGEEGAAGTKRRRRRAAAAI